MQVRAQGLRSGGYIYLVLNPQNLWSLICMFK